MKRQILSITAFFMFAFIAYCQTATIGKQVWSTKNLDVSTFRNGDPIPQAKTKEEWDKAGSNKQPAWCYYDNDPSNGTKYGKLYNWYAVNDSRGLAPRGWHIPSDAEWTTLTNYLGGESVAGTKMKSIKGWEDYQPVDEEGNNIGKPISGNGNNSSGFLGLPGGYRYYDGYFYGVGYFGYWWSSSEYDSSYAWGRLLNFGNGRVVGYYGYKGNGYSVRCLRD